MTEYKYIYQMSWYDKHNSKKPSTLMYYLNEKDTRFGHNWPVGLNGSSHCIITIIQVIENSFEYKCAVNNSNLENGV
jgi:hypothetical protein